MKGLAFALALLTLAGCTGPCTLTTPARAEAVLDADAREVAAALAEEGWIVEPGPAVHARRNTSDGVLQASAAERGDGRTLLMVFLPLQERGAQEAERLLQPRVQRILAHFPNATASYHGSVQHCGDI